MPIEPIQNGESGLSVRNKLNQLLLAVGDGGGAEYVDGRIGELTEWIDGSVQDLIDRANQLADELTAEQVERVAQAQQAAADALAMRNTIQTLAADLASQGYEDYQAREALRTSLQAELGAFATNFDERIIVAISDLESVAQRATTLETQTDDLGSRITEVQQSLTTEVSSLAQSIESMVVGTATQFDTAAIWYFDEALESWTGYPAAPTRTADGFLRPANNGEYIQSPAIPATETIYRQIRARLRRSGAPTWRGRVWWSNDGTTWSAAPDKVVDEPGWGDDFALLTIDAPGTGTIRAIRLDLVTNSATDFVEFDWIAVGRPAPGASTAEVNELRRAYIDADEALADRIDVIGADLNTADGRWTGTSEAVDALTVRVEDTETGISAASDAITALESRVDDKADAEAVDALNTRVDQFDDGSTEVQAQSTRALRSMLRGVALESLTAGMRTNEEMRRTVDVFAEASNSMNTKIESNDERLRLLSESVTLLRSEVPGLAKSTALQALRTDVTVAEGNIKSQADAITRLQVEIPNLATASALQALSTDVGLIDGRVDANSKAITSLQTTVDGKANASALNALTTRVGTAEGKITATSDALTALDSTVGNFSASGRLRITTEATPTGALSRIGFKAAADDGEGDWRQAAFYLEAMTGGVSRGIFRANYFAFFDSSQPDGLRYPLVIRNGAVYINTATIEDLSVGRFKIGDEAVTTSVYAYAGGTQRVTNGGNWVELQRLVYTKGRASPFDVQLRFDWINENTRGANGAWPMFRLLRNGAFVREFTGAGVIVNNYRDRIQEHRIVDVRAVAEVTTYVLQVNMPSTWEYMDVANRFIGVLNVHK